MESRKFDIGEVYGYAVCLTAILIFLLGTARMLNAVLDLRELPYAEAYIDGPSLVSLEAYRIDLLGRIETERGSEAVMSAIPADSTWYRMFEKERLHRLALSHQQSRTKAVVNAVLSGLSAILFVSHWRWLQKRAGVTDAERSGIS